MKARSAVAFATAAVLAVVVAACGSSSSGSSGTISGTNLTVYSSLPLQGASRVNSVAVNNGAQIALSAVGGKVGKYTITFKQLDDSTAASGKWDPGQTTSDAHTVPVEVQIVSRARPSSEKAWPKVGMITLLAMTATVLLALAFVVTV